MERELWQRMGDSWLITCACSLERVGLIDGRQNCLLGCRTRDRVGIADQGEYVVVGICI